jgi:hypothetical protein
MKVEQFGKQDRSGGVPRISGRERRWAGSPPPETRPHTDIAQSRGSGMVGVMPPLTQDRAY